jgi:hypothetical protein
MIAINLPGAATPVIGKLASGLVGGGGSSIPTIAPPPPPPKDSDPAISEAQKKLQLAEKKRRGRAATLIADQDQLGDVSVSRPAARAAVFGG